MYAPEDLHITVAFFGAIPEEVATRVWTGHTSLIESANILLGPVQLFGRPGRATALGFNVLPHEPRRMRLAGGRSSEEIQDAFSKLTTSLRSARDTLLDLAECRPDEREPRPHVTVARIPRDASSRERRRGIGWAERLVVDEPVTLDAIALYTWSDRAESTARFRIVDEHPL